MMGETTHQVVSRRILYEYPRPIRQAYASMVGDPEPSSRHRRLAELGGASLAWFASLAVSDYRSQRYGNPDRNIEEALARSQRLDIANYLEIWRIASAATQAAVFDLKQPGLERELLRCRRFKAAVIGLQDTFDLEAQNIERAISVRLEQSMKKVTWFDFWAEFAEYCNRTEGHATSHKLPTAHADYFRLMTPLVEAALTEALLMSNVARVFSEFPVAQLTDVRCCQDNTFSHQFTGENSGLPFQTEVRMDQSVTDIWAHEGWQARIGSSFLLDGTPSDGYEVRSLFHDLIEQGLPQPLEPVRSKRPSQVFHQAAGASTTDWAVASVSAPGTCGEFAQGIIPDDVHFHVTCPITKTTTVRVRVRPSPETRIEGLSAQQVKIEVALRRTIELLEVEPLEIFADHWTDLEVGKGMGSSTADIVAAASALASALGQTLKPEQIASIATSIESSDGTMYPGVAVVNHKTGEALRRYEWWPEFVLVMVVPATRFNTESAHFEGKERLAHEYVDMLEQFDHAIASRDATLFASQSTRSAQLNQQYVPNPFWLHLAAQAERYGAIGANVAHTGTLCALIFEHTQSGMQAAAEACLDVAQKLPSNICVELTTTPPSPDV